MVFCGEAGNKAGVTQPISPALAVLLGMTPFAKTLCWGGFLVPVVNLSLCFTALTAINTFCMPRLAAVLPYYF